MNQQKNCKAMKSISILSVCLLFVFTASAQTSEKKVHYEAQVDLGVVSNSAVKGKFAYGGTFEALIRLGEASNVPAVVGFGPYQGSERRNYLTFALKGMSNPFKGSPFLVTAQAFNKNGSDALNYAMLLVGYRADLDATDNPDNYLYFEPRIGLALSGGFHWAGFAISPAFGYQVKRVDLQVFLDGGFGSKELTSRTKSYITPGIGVGYTF